MNVGCPLVCCRADCGLTCAHPTAPDEGAALAFVLIAVFVLVALSRLIEPWAERPVRREQ